MSNDRWATLVSSIRRRRANLARFFKPVCVIAAIDLANEGLLDPASMNAEAIIARFKDYVSLIFAERADMGWKPLWHLSNDGLWTFYVDGQALGPDDFGADRKPGTKSILFSRFHELSIHQDYRIAWQDKDQRSALRHAMLVILANDNAECRRFAQQLLYADRAMQPALWPSESEVIKKLGVVADQLELFVKENGDPYEDSQRITSGEDIEDYDVEDIDVETQISNRTPIVTELEAVASPTARLNSASEIDLGTNPHIDSIDGAPQLDEYPEIQTVQINVILGSLPGNAPKSLVCALTAYKTELEKRGARPIAGILTNQYDIIDAEYRHYDAAEWLSAGIKDAGFPAFFREHKKFLQHFPFVVERENVISRIEVDEARATGEDLIKPFRAALAMAKAAQTAGVATVDVVQFMQELKQGAELLASLPNDIPLPAISNDDRLVPPTATPKQRLIGTAIGFVVRALNLSATAVGLGTASYSTFNQNLAYVLEMLKSLIR